MEPQKPPMGPEAGQDEGGGAKALVQGINNNLLKLKDLLAGVPSVSDDLKAKLDSLIQGYQSFIQEVAGGGGQEAPAPGPQAPAGPPRGGMGRATAMGGPGAKPAM